jgi:P pilus assembly chaperone PapD
MQHEQNGSIYAAVFYRGKCMNKWTYCLLGLFSASSFSYEMSPMYQDLKEVGKEAQGTYTLYNSEDKPLMIESSVYHIHYNQKTKHETSVLDEDSFLILPPQAIIQPNATQRFVVRYLGKTKLNDTQIYRVNFEQVSITPEVETENSEIEMLFNFSTLAFVSPNDCIPTSSSKVASGELLIENTSRCLLDMSELKFDFESNSKSKSYNWDELSLKSKSIYLLPSQQVSFSLPKELAAYTSVSSKLKSE